MADKLFDRMSAIIADKTSGESFLRRQKQQEELDHERQLATIRAGSRPATPSIPPLAVAQVDELTAIERDLKLVLKDCFDSNEELAHELKFNSYLHAYVIKFFDFYIAAYLPYIAQFPSWAPQFSLWSVEWVLNCLVHFNGITEEDFMGYPDMLVKTLRDHVLSLHIRYESSDNPLLNKLGEKLSETFISSEGMSSIPKVKGGFVNEAETIPSTPQDLHRKYKTEFPEVKILDICWAARQTYREWKRWMSGTAVPGHTPDLSFRKILTGGKHTKEWRSEVRLKSWR